jgi:hypothetical protein
MFSLFFYDIQNFQPGPLHVRGTLSHLLGDYDCDTLLRPTRYMSVLYRADAAGSWMFDLPTLPFDTCAPSSKLETVEAFSSAQAANYTSVDIKRFVSSV